MFGKYGFPLCIQLAVPDDINDPDFESTLGLLQELDFYGVELNVTDFSETAVEELLALLRKYDLVLTELATGAYARKNGLSLGSKDEKIRKRSVDALCSVLIPFAEKAGCDIICGFMKGDTSGDREALSRSVEEVAARCEGIKPRIYLEATNHYEAACVNTVGEGADMATGPWGVLPDTYHMNIEESSTASAITTYSDLYRNIHLSDNNRYFPGFGAVDFFQVLCLLKAIGYEGTMAVEGRDHGDLRKDIYYTASYLENVAVRL